jgi:hypothetical protein
MNIPFESRCTKCGTTNAWNTGLNQDEIEWTCRNCGHLNHETFQDNLTMGPKILWRASRELSDHHDASLSIVLSAMALECEATRLYRKHLITTGKNPSEDEFEEELRKLGSRVTEKIDRICRTMDSGGLDAFVQNSPDISQYSHQELSWLSGRSLIDAFQKQVFWPRNSILHAGKVSFGEKEAWEVYELASFGVAVLRRMELAKYGSIV